MFTTRVFPGLKEVAEGVTAISLAEMRDITNSDKKIKINPAIFLFSAINLLVFYCSKEHFFLY